ncbi:hypothetical protein ACFV0O_03780 [Kitasatospora sp. NPDC059577]|uniref:hypothetical protein n=1 Tax=Kitasatospora sp. NPDC059577 TaxID=3346873 RepID=UPI00367BA2AD
MKSRQERVGDFTVPDVSAHLVTMAKSHARREEAGLTGLPVLVLERPIAGEVFTDWGRPLSDLPTGHPLLRALDAKAEQAGLSKDEIEAWCGAVSIYTLPWRAAAEDTCTAVWQRFGVLPAAAEAIVLGLRNAVAGCADSNAETRLDSAVGLSRTSIERISTEIMESIDPSSMEEALASAVCEPVDFDRPLRSAAFYEGIDVQPGHIAAGLPAPRPTLTGHVAAAIGRGESVLVSGPSGVGKSTVMWAAAYTTRHVLWYRIRRLRNEDISALVRLARALRPSTRSPVGFVVDGIGVGAAEAWDVLHREMAPIPGVILLGSVRSEDLLPLRSRANCTQIAVKLDEDVAEQIHSGLSASGATTALHWREAFAASGGLTLEFTHLLTRGRRLLDVLTEQVDRRLFEGRQAEIEILARISVAHRWGVDLSVRELQKQLGIGDVDLRAALSRLVDEHLVHEQMGQLSGLHQLRSGRLADAVHAVPPPMLDETVIAVLGILSDAQLQPFVAGVLSERPDLDSVVLDQVCVELARRTGVGATIGVLQALRLVDFTRCARDWARILDRHQVSPAHRRVTLKLALMGGEPLPNLKPEIAAAMVEIAATGQVGVQLRDTLMERIGTDALGRVLAQCGNQSEVLRFLAVLDGTDADFTGWPAELADSPFGRLLVDSPIQSLGDILTEARSVSAALAENLLDLAGGEDVVLRKIRAHSPWVTEASVLEREGSLVAFARLLHVSDQVQPDVDQTTNEFGRLLLRCLPRCESVDVQILLPGGVPLTFGDFTTGVSQLQRRYDSSSARVAWIRARTLIATTAAGTTDWTTRTATAAAIVPTLHRYLATLTRIWCTGRSRPEDIADLETMQAALRDQAAALTLPTDSAGVSALLADDAVEDIWLDRLQLLVDGIADNLTRRLLDPQEHRSLACYIQETLRETALRVRDEERWYLIGLDPPDLLIELSGMLADLHAVLAELVWGTLEPKAIIAEARSGPSAQALARAAVLARRTADERARAVHLKLKTAAEARGLSLRLYTQPFADAKAAEWPAVRMAVGVELDELAEWPAALENLAALLQYDLVSKGARKGVLIAPIVKGRLVRALAQQLHITLWPGSDLLDSWDTGLPAVHPTPLTDATIAGHQALQCLSGLAYLMTLRDPEPRHQSAVDQAAAEFTQALRIITELGPADSGIGEVVDFLTSLAHRVAGEFAAATARLHPEMQHLAISIAQGATGSLTVDHQELDRLMEITLNWDLCAAQTTRLSTSGDG